MGRLVGAGLALGTLAYFIYASTGPSEQVFMPGTTSHGHYQIEMQCTVCHTKGMGVKQDSCNACHAEELTRVDDSHPVIKFKDPRNAPRLEKLDARYCVTCHREHQPEETGEMGLSLPEDYCFHCHEGIEETIPSHEGMAFDTCATAGCHNFHDNSGLYERFLVDSLDQPDHRPAAREWLEAGLKPDPDPSEALTLALMDAPRDAPVTHRSLHDWENTAHAQSGVNCTDCHTGGESGVDWIDQPDHSSCQECHKREVSGFLEGRHGMRLAEGLSPMRPELARQPMKVSAHGTELTCVTCHGAHRFNTEGAAIDSCLQCHDDGHSTAYLQSPHYRVVRDEALGLRPEGSGPTCATCHMPKVERTEFGESVWFVDHNQNNTLRPNEKMIRPVCNNCHGLQFTLNALADPALIENNFSGAPSVFVESLEMARRKKEKLEAER